MNNETKATATVNPITDDIIMDLIIAIYYNMNDDDKATWSLEAAQDVINDQIKIDKVAGRTALPYVPEDFYLTIQELIQQDEF